MQKIKALMLVLSFFAPFPSSDAQEPAIIVKSETVQGMKLAQATPINKSLLHTMINKLFLTDLKIRIDKEKSFMKVGSNKKVLQNIEQEIEDSGNSWTYYPLDINSISASFSIRPTNDFVLTVNFEGVGSEVKGVCLGCPPNFRDQNAPDIQWAFPRQVEIIMKAIPYNNSIAFEVKQVRMNGEFKLNEPKEELLLPINYFRNAIKDLMERAIKELLNEKEIKDQMATEFASFLRPLGIDTVSQISFNQTSMIVYP